MELLIKVKVEVIAVLVSSPSLITPYGFRGREVTLNSDLSRVSELSSCVKVEVAVLGSSPSPISLDNYGLYVGVKQH